MPNDLIHRFIFDGTDVRGEFVQLQQSVSDIVDSHDYPEPVAMLMGELLTAAVLLNGTIKLQGRLILQIRSEAQLPLAMVEINHEQKLRGIARLNDAIEDYSSEFNELVGGGTLVVTVDPEEGERYQSLVLLQGKHLAESLEIYFAQSEQLGTRLMLAAKDNAAAGLLLQQLPVQETPDPKRRAQQWEHLTILGNTATADEMLSLDITTLLNRLYVEETVRLLDERPVSFECSCSAARTAESLITLAAQQLDYLFAEDETIDVNCEFCGTTYTFTRASLSQTAKGNGAIH